MRSHLSPCIAQLAVAASSGETHWKKLNHQLLMKTRESKPMVSEQGVIQGRGGGNPPTLSFPSPKIVWVNLIKGFILVVMHC